MCKPEMIYNPIYCIIIEHFFARTDAVRVDVAGDAGLVFFRKYIHGVCSNPRIEPGWRVVVGTRENGKAKGSMNYIQI